MFPYLIAIAVLAGIFGFFSLSQSTMGPGIICIGCLVGILARICQAEVHHKSLSPGKDAVENRPKGAMPSLHDQIVAMKKKEDGQTE